MDLVLSAPNSDGAVLAWDLRTGIVKQSFRQARCVPDGVAVVQGVPSPDHVEPSYILAAQSNRPSVNAYEWEKGNLMFKCSMPEVLRMIKTTNDGMFAVGGGGSGNLYVWETSTGRLLRVFAAHFKAITCGCFADDCSFFITGGDDGLVKVWWLEDLIRDPKVRGPTSGAPSPVNVYSGHMLPITAVTCTHGGARGRVLSVSKDKTLRVWTFASPHAVATVNLKGTPTAMALGVLDSCAFIGVKEGSVLKVQLSTFIGPDTPSTFPAQPSQQTSSSTQADSDSASSDYCSQLGEHRGGVLSIAISSCSTLLLTGGVASGIHVWDIASGQLVKTFDNHKSGVASITVLPITTFTFTGKKPRKALPLGPLKKFTGSGTTWAEGFDPVIVESSMAVDEDGNVAGITANGPLSGKRLRKRMWEVVESKALPSSEAQEGAQATDNEEGTTNAGARKRTMVASVLSGEAGSREKVQQLEERVSTMQKEIARLEQENKRWEKVSKKLFMKAKGKQ